MEEENVYRLIRKQNIVGYNYVSNFLELLICKERMYYENGSCTDDLGTICLFASDSSNTCLKCPSSEKYLHKDNNCYSTCPISYFGDDYLSQCRKCFTGCATCFGRNATSCLTCEQGYYFLKLNNSCVSNCEMFKLTVSPLDNMTCIDCIQ